MIGLGANIQPWSLDSRTHIWARWREVQGAPVLGSQRAVPLTAAGVPQTRAAAVGVAFGHTGAKEPLWGP